MQIACKISRSFYSNESNFSAANLIALRLKPPLAVLRDVNQPQKTGFLERIRLRSYERRELSDPFCILQHIIQRACRLSFVVLSGTWREEHFESQSNGIVNHATDNNNNNSNNISVLDDVANEETPDEDRWKILDSDLMGEATILRTDQVREYLQQLSNATIFRTTLILPWDVRQISHCNRKMPFVCVI